MDLQSLLSTLTSFIASYPLMALGTGIIMAIYLWKKPWEFLKFSTLLVLLALAIYGAMQLGQSTQSGVDNKQTMINETQQKITDR